MKTTNSGIELIKKFEGCRLTAYKDVVGVLTIGYGHTKNVYEGMTISLDEANDMLLEDISIAEKTVDKYDIKYNFSEHEYNALVSFAFNLGSIDKLTANGTRTKEVIASKIKLYNKAGGKVNKGLTQRRKEEYALFIRGLLSSAKIEMPTLRYGDSGDNVRILQNALLKNRFKTAIVKGKKKMLKSDGEFGIITITKVKDWQEYKGLTVDGIVGKKTWQSLGL